MCVMNLITRTKIENVTVLFSHITTSFSLGLPETKTALNEFVWALFLSWKQKACKKEKRRGGGSCGHPAADANIPILFQNALSYMRQQPDVYIFLFQALILHVKMLKQITECIKKNPRQLLGEEVKQKKKPVRSD